MFGLGYQELLLVVVLLFLYLTLLPGLIYLFVYVLLWVLKSPRLVLAEATRYLLEKFVMEYQAVLAKPDGA